ncbi:MAG: sugar kinase [Clostridia bacterium]|nr:sugar kinase [Clostridia bacterium]
MKTVCFGEIMGRISPIGYKRFVQSDLFEITYGGGEANVAVSLANFGKDAAYVTKLPDNDIAQSAIRSLRAHGVDCSMIVRGGERIGLYYCEKGASQRPSKVIYDRKHSSISTAESGDFDWKKIFSGCAWFHFTGITPALSDSCAAITEEACKAAKAAGVTVSCDLNFRKNLWSSEKAGQVMARLMPYVDVAIANEEDCDKVFGIKAEGTDVTGGKLNREGYEQVAKQLSDRFGIPTVAITLRTSISASDNVWAGMLYRDGRCFFSKSYNVHIVDRVGGGDSFGGGLIYALQENYESQAAIEFAVAASALKHSVENDFNEVSVKEVQNLAAGDGTGRVQR